MYFVPLSAPDGCLQYYTKETGSIESFNWRMQSSPYPALTSYAICIKRHQTSLASYCGITFAAATQGNGKFVVWSLYFKIAMVYRTLCIYLIYLFCLVKIPKPKHCIICFLSSYVMLSNTIRFKVDCITPLIIFISCSFVSIYIRAFINYSNYRMITFA